MTGRLLALSGLTAIAGGSSVVAYFDPSASHFFPVCPLYALTGFACPGCGLTRGYHALFHGDVLTALHFNALIPIYSLIFGYLFISLALLAVGGKGLSFAVFGKPWVLWSAAILALAFAVVRNVPAYPFILLYP
jgi:Protein of unknown function (DUF2752).